MKQHQRGAGTEQGKVWLLLSLFPMPGQLLMCVCAVCVQVTVVSALEGLKRTLSVLHLLFLLPPPLSDLFP